MFTIASRTRITDIQRFISPSRMTYHSEPDSKASPSMIEDYKKWRAMGEGGTPPNLAGYLSCISAEKTMAFKDTISPDIYRRPEKYATGWLKATPSQKAASQRSFLKEPLPEREGPRSRAKRYVYHQREKNAAEYLEPEIQEVRRTALQPSSDHCTNVNSQAWQTAFSELGKANASSTEWKTSALEKHGTALFLIQSMPLSPLASPSKREICHIHTSDMSGHVTLSFVDAEEVIAKGWGERHRLSGTDWIHLGYTMVYVPRSVDETEIMQRIFQAGIDFMKAS